MMFNLDNKITWHLSKFKETPFKIDLLFKLFKLFYNNLTSSEGSIVLKIFPSENYKILDFLNK